MKAKHHGKLWGRIILKVMLGVLIPGSSISEVAVASDGSEGFRAGARAEARLDLFGARDHLREAIATNPGNTGWRERTAWFLYIHGFHDRECLALFEKVRPSASDRAAVDRAISHLREKLGQTNPTARKPVVHPGRNSRAHGLPGRLQHARELFWSGATEESKAAFHALIRELPNEPSLRWELAKVLVAKGSYGEAVDQLRVAREFRPNEPELVLDHAIAEALRGRRWAAVRILKEAEFPDPAAAHIARARAHHYAGEFVPAAREYERAMTTRPYDEIAAHGLAEARLRNHDIAGAGKLIENWQGREVATDWSDRHDLQRELAATRLRGSAAYLANSEDYRRWDVGSDLRARPWDEVGILLALSHGWFDQKGFSSIDRWALDVSARYQPDSYWAVYGEIGVHEYSHGWTSLVGGLGLMWRPVSSLELNLAASHTDVADAEWPLGYAIYGMGTTIGAVGGRATMDALSLTASWTPIENIDLFAKYRIADLSGGNRLVDAFFAVTYTVARDPFLRFGYGIDYTDVNAASPVFTQGAAATNYYYDPDNKVAHHLYAEHAGHAGGDVHYGVEARVILNQGGGVGFGAGAHLQYRWSDHQAVRLDARYFVQDRSRDRNNLRTGHYHALNLIASYEYRF